MKFKFKVSNETTLKDVKEELDFLKTVNVTELPLNHLRRIIGFLGAEEIKATGSSVRFKHQLLNNHRHYFGGMFQVHKLHKGGDIDQIRKIDYNKYLYPVLIEIIELIEHK